MTAGEKTLLRMTAGGRDAPQNDSGGKKTLPRMTAGEKDAPQNDSGGKKTLLRMTAGGRDAPQNDSGGKDAPQNDSGGKDAPQNDSASAAPQCGRCRQERLMRNAVPSHTLSKPSEAGLRRRGTNGSPVPYPVKAQRSGFDRERKNEGAYTELASLRTSAVQRAHSDEGM